LGRKEQVAGFPESESRVEVVAVTELGSMEAAAAAAAAALSDKR